MGHQIIGDVARQIGANPRDISTFFYCRKLDVVRCPVVGGRRMIPLDYVPVIEAALREAGKIRDAVPA